MRIHAQFERLGGPFFSKISPPQLSSNFQVAQLHEVLQQLFFNVK